MKLGITLGVLALAGLMLPTSVANGAAPTAQPTVRVQKIGAVTATQAISADGQTTVTITGSQALPATITTDDANTTEAETALPSVKTKLGGPALSDADSAAAPTVYEDLIAGGDTPEEACAFVADFDSRGCQTSATIMAKKNLAGPVTMATSSGRAPYDSWCSNISSYKGDGHKTSHACVIRYRDYAFGGNWYLANTMKQTAHVVNPGTFFDRFNDIRVQMRYASGNTTVDWSPIGTRSVGSCQTTSTSVTSPKTGASYSSSNEVCPDKIAPYTNTDFRWFGSRWTTSKPRSGYVGNVASSVVHSPASASSAATLYSYIHWN